MTTDPTPTPSVLTPEDSKRVADYLIAAIDDVRVQIITRHQIMCQNMENEQFNTQCTLRK